jgi:hypothetical protein
MSIYVEILIRGNMDDLWQKTQEPKLHGRWDLRFSQIDYLPRAAGEAQKFLYSTRIGAGNATIRLASALPPSSSGREILNR